MPIMVHELVQKIIQSVAHDWDYPDRINIGVKIKGMGLGNDDPTGVANNSLGWQTLPPNKVSRGRHLKLVLGGGLYYCIKKGQTE